MAIEYNNIYFHIKRRPSRKSMMVCIPFYMYRIETNEFEHGLNFFQKIVLKFRARPGVKNEAIAEYTGLDKRLIEIVTGELQSKQLINEHGSLSEKGKEMLMEVDGLVINSGKKKIGYVFKYVNQDKLYPFYISQVVPADVLEDSKRQQPIIVTGTKGDGEDFTDLPFFLDEAIKTKSNYNRPSEREVLQRIKNSNRKGNNQEEDEVKNEKLSNQLSVRFLNDQPEVVWACTYVYLHQHEDETYEPDWRILDPFGFGDNIGLRIYINNPVNKHLLESIHNRFADAITLGGKIVAEYHQQLDKHIEDKLNSDFYLNFVKIDSNLNEYLCLLIRSVLMIEASSYTDKFASDHFTGYLHKILETIIKIDKEKRPEVYLEVYDRFDIDYKTRKNALIQLWRIRFFTKDTLVPDKLSKLCNNSLKFASSLKGHFIGFALTYLIDNKHPLLKIFNNRTSEIIEISDFRNIDSHGQTSNEKALKPMSKEEVEKYYGYIKSFLNEYIQYN